MAYFKLLSQYFPAKWKTILNLGTVTVWGQHQNPNILKYEANQAWQHILTHRRRMFPAKWRDWSYFIIQNYYFEPTIWLSTSLTRRYFCMFSIQCDSGGKVSILGHHSISHSMKKRWVHVLLQTVSKIKLFHYIAVQCTLYRWAMRHVLFSHKLQSALMVEF
jgi:hypothetical protein